MWLIDGERRSPAAYNVRTRTSIPISVGRSLRLMKNKKGVWLRVYAKLLSSEALFLPKMHQKPFSG